MEVARGPRGGLAGRGTFTARLAIRAGQIATFGRVLVVCLTLPSPLEVYSPGIRGSNCRLGQVPL